MSDATNPSHYKWHPVCECIDISEHFTKNLGSALEYIWRAGRKGSDTFEQDLKKAIWYLEREMKLRAKPEEPVQWRPAGPCKPGFQNYVLSTGEEWPGALTKEQMKEGVLKL